jgi:hypothetical protein
MTCNVITSFSADIKDEDEDIKEPADVVLDWRR